MPGTEPDGQNPFIERPDEHEVQGDELYCWMPGTDHRECNPGCVAFEERSLVEDSNLDMCKVLNSIRTISGSLAAQVKAKKIEQRQAVASSQPEPPEVR
jgi:ArsR family metal-binding transcriptional regulator